jgi:hypothetical protein
MDVVLAIRKVLKEKAQPKIAASAVRFFKESIECYGVKTPDVRSLAKETFKTMKHFSKEDVFEACEQLWQSGNHEEGLVACFWSDAVAKQLAPSDFEILERWIDLYVSNWALCDTFCNHTIGKFLIKFPEFLPRIKKWTVHKNRWMRRAASVSLIVPARQGDFMNEILEIASLLLEDQDDLVQKGYGWLLKVAAEHHLEVVFEFVLQNKRKMPRTALRYAIEKMPSQMKKKAMS